MFYDPEAVYQDDDILQAQYEADARQAERLRRRGVCTHDHVIGGNADVYYVQDHLDPEQKVCTGCGFVFDDDEHWYAALDDPVSYQTEARTKARSDL